MISTPTQREMSLLSEKALAKFQRFMDIVLTATDELSGQDWARPLHYDLNLRTDTIRKRIALKVVMTLKAMEAGQKHLKTLLGVPGMTRLRVSTATFLKPTQQDARDGTVPITASRSIPIQFSHRPPVLTLTLPEIPAPGDTFTIALEYEGTVGSPKNYVGVSGSELNGEGLWYPMIGFPPTPITATATIDVADSESTAFSGKMVSTVSGSGRTVSKWVTETPIVSMTFVSGPFRTSKKHVNGIDLRVMCQPLYYQAAASLADLASSVISAGAEWFGPLPLHSIYLVQPRRSGYGEYAHMPFIVYARENLAKRPDAESTMRLFEATAHELGHFWWGNVVGSDSIAEGWLSEGFADFTKVLALEETHGRQEAARMLRRMAEVLEETGEAPPLGVIHMSHPKQGQVVRRKGGLFLEALRQKVGDDAMKALLHYVYDSFAGRVMTTPDFLEAVRTQCGASAASFARKHLYEPVSYIVNGIGSVSTKE